MNLRENIRRILMEEKYNLPNYILRRVSQEDLDYLMKRIKKFIQHKGDEETYVIHSEILQFIGDHMGLIKLMNYETKKEFWDAWSDDEREFWPRYEPLRDIFIDFVKSNLEK